MTSPPPDTEPVTEAAGSSRPARKFPPAPVIVLGLALALAAVLAVSLATRDRRSSTVLWTVLLGGSGSDAFTAAGAAPDGGVALAAQSDSPDGHFGPSRGGTDAWTVRLGPDGAVLWKTRIAGSLDDSVSWLAADSDGGWLALGETASRDGDFAGRTGPPGRRDWAAKLDGSGRIAWLRILDGLHGDVPPLSAAAGPEGDMFLAGPAGAEGDGARGCGGGPGVRVRRLTREGSEQEAFCAPLAVFGGLMAIAPATRGGLAVAYNDWSAETSLPAIRVAAFSAGGELAWNSLAGEAKAFRLTLWELPGGGWAGTGDGGVGSWAFGVGPDGSGPWLVPAPRNASAMASAPAGGGIASVGQVTLGRLRGGWGMWDVQAAVASPGRGFFRSVVLGGSGEDRGIAAAGTADGGVVVAGRTESLDGDLASVPPAGQGPGSPSAWAVKLRP
ncbi:MAG: hypothetical protein LBT40_01985 [Deltaproteobacteria bacterium]|jgi:hypothetical protein|nr:hypothetical protein [Deltaproteobacteria bacterium]